MIITNLLLRSLFLPLITLCLLVSLHVVDVTFTLRVVSFGFGLMTFRSKINQKNKKKRLNAMSKEIKKPVKSYC